jgi:hypothetical protein
VTLGIESRVLIGQRTALVVEISATGVKLQNSTGAITLLAWRDLFEAGHVRR